MNSKYQFIEPSKEERDLYFQFYKKEMFFSLQNFKFCESVDLVKCGKNNILKKNIFDKIDDINFVVVEKQNRKGVTFRELKVSINKNHYYLSSLRLNFKCQKCNDPKIVYCNPSRDLKHFKSLSCESCYKSEFYSSEIYQNKFKNSMMKKWGVAHPIQNVEINKRIKNTMIERYGVPYSAMNDDLLKKSVETSKKNNKNFGESKVQKYFTSEVHNILVAHNLQNYETNKNIKNEHGKRYNVDIVIPEINLIIEFFGDYFHGNPSIYNEQDFISHKSVTRIELNKKDDIRIEALKNMGFHILIVWEDDWRKNKNQVLHTIEDKINEIKK